MPSKDVTKPAKQADADIYDEKGQFIGSYSTEEERKQLLSRRERSRPLEYYRVRLNNNSKEGFISIACKELRELRTLFFDKLGAIKPLQEPAHVDSPLFTLLFTYAHHLIEIFTKRNGISPARIALFLIEECKDPSIHLAVMGIFSESIKDEKERLFERHISHYFLMQAISQDTVTELTEQGERTISSTQFFFEQYEALGIDFTQQNDHYGTFFHEFILNQYQDIGHLFDAMPPSLKHNLLKRKDSEGNTPWMLALKTRNIALLEKMRKHYQEQENTQNVRGLKQLTLKDKQGRTPLMIALAMGLANEAELIGRHHCGHCLTQKDHGGQDVLSYLHLSPSVVEHLLSDIGINPDRDYRATSNHIIVRNQAIEVDGQFLLQSYEDGHQERLSAAIDFYSSEEGKNADNAETILRELNHFKEQAPAQPTSLGEHIQQQRETMKQSDFITALSNEHLVNSDDKYRNCIKTYLLTIGFSNEPLTPLALFYSAKGLPKPRDEQYWRRTPNRNQTVNLMYFHHAAPSVDEGSHEVDSLTVGSSC